jgi:hypothetical protein
MSRIAKQLVNKRSGRSASYGLVLEELLQSRGQTYELPGPQIKPKMMIKPTEKKARTKGDSSPGGSPSGRTEEATDLNSMRSPKLKGESTVSDRS